MTNDLELESEVDQDIIRRARTDILAFALAIKDDYEINWHHRAIARKLNAFVRGDIQYLMVFMPPRHGKSQLVSRFLPAYLHGLYPDSEIMAVSYLDTLAGDMTVDVQNIIDSPNYKKIFPNTKIYPGGTRYSVGTRNSSEHHIVGRKGKYRGQGVGGSFTGKGSNFSIVDDPIKGREVADSETFRDRLWKFYNNDLFSRLETNLKTGRRGQMLITMCMTGDTLVLMADGTQKPLKDIKIGDSISSYENGKIAVSTIKNWKSQGPDFIYRIKTSSGIIVKANERHPFLVCRNGNLEWVRLKDLRLNDKMIHVGEYGKGLNALSKNVKKKSCAKDFANRIITKINGHQGYAHHQTTLNPEEYQNLDIDTVLKKETTINWLKNRMGNALFAKIHPSQALIYQNIGNKDSAWTTIIKQAKRAACYVINAISSSNTPIRRKYCFPPLNTYKLTLDNVVEIKEFGIEEVFDIEVDRTENFIANGLVSHNTRWHEDDLAGRLLDLAKKEENAVQWDVLNYPAIRITHDDRTDPRAVGDALWPDKYNLDQLNQIKSSSGIRAWGSLYQQDPVPDGVGLFNQSMFGFVDAHTQFDYSFITADTAYKERQENDFTVFSCFGVIGDVLYVRDVWRRQIKSTDVEVPAEKFIRQYMNYGYRQTWIEPKGHGIYLNQAFQKKGLGIPSDNDMKEFYSDRRFDKVERANNVVPHLAFRKVYFCNSIAEKEELVLECLRFPKAAHDDFCDTLIDALKIVYSGSTGILDTV